MYWYGYKSQYKYTVQSCMNSWNVLSGLKYANYILKIADTMNVHFCNFHHSNFINLKIGMDEVNSEPLNFHCDCPAGKGLHGKCKYVAAVLLMIEAFVEKGTLGTRKGCTDN